MKQETNNEIDLLLRRLSRQDASAPNGDLHVETDHLDADELSSYAENALPATARARYTEHLAECSRCRELVVQLSSSAGVVVEEPARVSEPSGFRKFLASLFSPMVMRYSIPALATLVVVAVIGFSVFRSTQRNSPYMATQRRIETAPVAQPSDSRGEYAQDSQEKSDANVATPAARGLRKEIEPPAPNATPAANVAADSASAAPVHKYDSPPAATEAAPPPPAAATPAAPKPAETVDEVRKSEPEAKKQSESEATKKQAEQQGRFRSANEAERRASPQTGTVDTQLLGSARRPAKDKAMVSGQTQGAGAPSRDSAEKDSDDAETRSVSGRRFRKQKGVWVDTAYDGGATVNLARGSEQYRALVADEPSIKTIAEQLDGQIIVVWKGRAYKIR